MPQLQTDRPTCMQNKNWPWRHPRWTLFHHLWAQQCDCLLQTPGPPSPPVQPFLEPSQTLPLSCHGPGLLHHYSQKCTPKTRQKVMYKNTMVCHMIIFGGEKKKRVTYMASVTEANCVHASSYYLDNFFRQWHKRWLFPLKDILALAQLSDVPLAQNKNQACLLGMTPVGNYHTGFFFARRNYTTTANMAAKWVKLGINHVILH